MGENFLLLLQELGKDALALGQNQQHYDAVLAQLATQINDLINQDFHYLVQALYRLDIDEKKLKKLLQENPGEDAGKLIAALVIERQMEKQRTRELFRKNNPIDDGEEERW